MDKLQPEQTHETLKVLVSVIETLPPEIQVTLSGAVKQVNTTLNRRKRVLELVQSALGQLRVDVKYIVFDLEATRQERDELKAELDKK